MTVNRPTSAWRQPGFAGFLLALCFSNTSFQMASTAVAWQLYAATGRASDLGLIGLAQFLPTVFLALPAGHMADRFDRRLLVICGHLIALVAMLGLALQPTGSGFSRFILLALVHVTAIAVALEGPSFQSMVPGLVPANMLGNATAATFVVESFAQVAGPVLGGLLYVAGPRTVYITSTALFACSTLLMMRVRYTSRVTTRVPATLTELFAGLRFVRAQPDIFAVLSLDLFAVLLGGATALLPVFAKDILHTGPWGLGMLRMAPAAGELLVGAWLAHRALEKNVGMLMFACVAGFGVATIGFALSTQLVTSLIALAFLGGFDMVSMVIRGALVQVETPDDMRGRVSAVNSIFVGTSNKLGAFESGMVASLLGAVPAVVLGGVGTIVVAGLWMRWFPDLRRRQTLDVPFMA